MDLPVARHVTDSFAAIERCRRAPSIHNTQPWRFVVTATGIEIHADDTRRLAVLDPRGRDLAISCGAVLFELRTALQAQGYRPEVTLAPATAGGLLARVELGERGLPDPVAEILDRAAEARQTNRRRYSGALEDADVAQLLLAAEAESVGLQQLVSEDDRTAAKVWQQSANAHQLADPDYRRELATWVGGTGEDGIPVMATVAHSFGVHDFAVRDFDAATGPDGAGGGIVGAGSSAGIGAGLTGRGMVEEADDPDTAVFVLYTAGDDLQAWLTAGQGLARVWLEATVRGLAMQPLSQSLEEPGPRLMLRDDLRLLTSWPQLLLRVGHAYPQPRTGRRAAATMTSVEVGT